MAKQGHLIETVAIDELKTRRARLEVYQTQARYAVADSYDRAAKAQGSPTRRSSCCAGRRRTMMRSHRALFVVGAALLAACSSAPQKDTLATLHNVAPDLQDVKVEGGLDTAMQSYQRFLEETPETQRTPEAMRRLADLKIEKEYGLNGTGELLELPAPQAVDLPAASAAAAAKPRGEHRRRGGRLRAGARTARQRSSSASRPRRTCCRGSCPKASRTTSRAPVRSKRSSCTTACSRSIRPTSTTIRCSTRRRAPTTSSAAPSKRMKVMEQLIAAYPHSKYLDEVQFRRAEHFFTRKKYRDAEGSYEAIIAMGPVSEYYELALYKLGWSLYKQELYDEALHRYVALLDYKVSIGYDFDAQHEEGDERRIADTFDIISLSFSNLGGPEAVQQYFGANGKRSYEDRVYRNLGEYYLTKLRYHDAAKSYNTFIAQYPLHRRSPHFSMRVIEIYETGRFPQLVLDSKKAFASNYGLSAEYWRHFDVQQSPEVLSYLKSNLRDLANHYHAQYQDKGAAEQQGRQLRRGGALVRAVHRLVPRRRRDARDQLSAGGPAARESGLRRRGARVRAHRLRLREARSSRRRGLRRRLRASRASEGRRRAEQARPRGATR